MKNEIIPVIRVDDGEEFWRMDTFQLGVVYSSDNEFGFDSIEEYATDVDILQIYEGFGWVDYGVSVIKDQSVGIDLLDEYADGSSINVNQGYETSLHEVLSTSSATILSEYILAIDLNETYSDGDQAINSSGWGSIGAIIFADYTQAEDILETYADGDSDINSLGWGTSGITYSATGVEIVPVLSAAEWHKLVFTTFTSPMTINEIAFNNAGVFYSLSSATISSNGGTDSMLNDGNVGSLNTFYTTEWDMIVHTTDVISATEVLYATQDNFNGAYNRPQALSYYTSTNGTTWTLGSVKSLSALGGVGYTSVTL